LGKKKDLIVRFAGDGGQGVVTSAEILAKSAAQAGFHVLTFATFPSQIMGGPTWTQTRISSSEVHCSGDSIDILVALNEEAFDSHKSEINSSGIILHDSSNKNNTKINSLGIPLLELARQVGEPRAANMVLMGVISAISGLSIKIFENFVAERFKAKGPSVITPNLEALKLGFEFGKTAQIKFNKLPSISKQKEDRIFISGNEALSIGSIAAGLESFVGYPISPASTILMFMEEHLRGTNKFAYQASSEIESITSIIGSSYAGKKSMTATAGPGFSLMSEGIGLAWMTEIPIVIANIQRGGPATGLPTKTEQSDLNIAINPAHGDMSLPVIAPGTIEECFYAGAKALNWAERYQGPVILLSEHNLSERRQNIKNPDLKNIKTENRQINTSKNGYARYNGNNVSPMPIPGKPGAYIANGSEHDPIGDTTHLALRHVQMTDRRFNKLSVLNDSFFELENSEAPIIIMPWGGSKGPVYEAYKNITNENEDIGWAYTMFINPLPKKLITILKKKKLVLIPELNSQGQFANILRSKGIAAESITQYTGLPFKVNDLEKILIKKSKLITIKRKTK